MKRFISTFLLCGVLVSPVLASNSKDDGAVKQEDKRSQATQSSDDKTSKRVDDKAHVEKTVFVVDRPQQVTTKVDDVIRIESSSASGSSVEAEVRGPGKLIKKRVQHQNRPQFMAPDQFEFEVQPQGKGLITVIVTKKHPASTRPEKTEFKIEVK